MKTKPTYLSRGFNKLLIIAAIIFIIGVVLGFLAGTEYILYKVAKVASGFIHIDKELISRAIYQYENHLSGCFPANFSL